jgi:hypothetical protein
VSDLSDLQTTKTQLIARLKSVTASDKPSYNIDGQQVSWTEYASMLRKEIEAVSRLIDAEEGPAEFHTITYT